MHQRLLATPHGDSHAKRLKPNRDFILAQIAASIIGLADTRL
jgi:hypothetical protein